MTKNYKKMEGERKVVINMELVREIMKKENMSQAELANRANLSKGTISRWLKGTRGEGPALISGIIRAFPDVPLEDLISVS